MEDLINLILNFSRENILLISLTFILLSNFIIPGSLIIIFYTTTLGFVKGIIASYLVLLIAVCIPYLLIRYFRLDYEHYFNEETNFIRTKIVNENPNKSILFVRFTFIPFVLQNILDILLTPQMIPFH